MEMVGQFSRLEIIWMAGAAGLERLKVSSTNSSNSSWIIPFETVEAPSEADTSTIWDSARDNLESSSNF